MTVFVSFNFYIFLTGVNLGTVHPRLKSHCEDDPDAPGHLAHHLSQTLRLTRPGRGRAGLVWLGLVGLVGQGWQSPQLAQLTHL